MTQTALLCGCGAPAGARGACSRCRRRARLSRERFAGEREAVLLRDGHQCRGCGSFDIVLVHHRRPGVSVRRFLVTICRRCHVKVHFARRPRLAWSPFLLELWRELHPGVAENRRLAFVDPAAELGVNQAGLFP